MSFLEFFTIIICISYVLFVLIIFAGSRKQISYKREKTVQKISILIPAKDEEENISACLEALLNQSLSDELFEVIVLNDNSSDKTEEIASTFMNKFSSATLINLSKESDNHLIGKSRAISIGIGNAAHELILICDADCKPNSDWLKTITEAFLPEVGVVSGFTLLETDSSNSFEVMQNLDWMMLQGMASGAAGISLPISCIGSNFAFRKVAYEEVGGYEKLPFSITEDLLLYKTLSKETSWKFVYPLSEGSINISKPMDSLKSLYEQRKRWAFGSLGIGGFGLFSMLLNGFAHLLPLLYFFLYEILTPLYYILFADTFFLFWLLFKLNRMWFSKYLLHYFFYYYFNILIFPIMFLFDRKIVWKDRTYNKGTA